MEIKICGITKKYEIDKLISEKVDYAGFVVNYPKSKRNNTIAMAKELLDYVKELNKDQDNYSLKTVAVTVSPSLSEIKEIEAAGFDIIQIHGNMDKILLEQINIPVFRAFNINDKQDISYIKDRKIEAILLDAAIPGQGEVFDWEKYAGFDAKDKKFILAGGLNASNVKDGIRKMHPDVVDCSSGVEYEDKSITGKDVNKIEQFVKEVRR